MSALGTPPQGADATGQRRTPDQPEPPLRLGATAPRRTFHPRNIGPSTEELFASYRTTPTRELRNELVQRHLHLVERCVRRSGYAHRDTEDLRQAAFLGLIGAVERFDTARGIQFSTFASRTIEGTIKRYLRDRTWSVRPPRRIQEIAVSLSAAEQRLQHSLGRPPTVAELAETLDESSDRVIEALEARGGRRASSLDSLIAAGVHSATPVSSEVGFERVEASITVPRLLERLDSSEREMIRLRFEEGWTEAAIGERLGLSQSYVSRQLRALLSKLRQIAETNDLVAP